MNKFKYLIYIFILSLQAFANEQVPVELIRGSKKVSVVFAGSKDGLSESSFGHISLRFSKEERLGLFDTSLQFVANLPERENKIKKYAKGFGLLGSYAYDVAIEVNSFTNYKLKTNKEEDRDITTLSLNLNENQRERLIDYIENFYSDGIRKYRFFNKNCSFFAADALEYATGMDLKAKSLPWKLPESLKNSGLIESEELSPSNSNLREQIVESLFASSMADMISDIINKERFRENLNSENINQKSAAYFSLIIAIKRLKEIEDIERVNELRDIYLSLSSKEGDHLSPYFKAILLKSQESMVHIIKTRFVSEKAYLMEEIDPETNLSISRGTPYLNLKWKNSQINESRRIPLNFLQYNAGTGGVFYGQDKVGHNIITRKENWISPTHLNFGVNLNAQEKELTAIFLVFPNDPSPKRTQEEIENLSYLALNNIFDFNQEDTLGACLAMVKLQKAMIERMSFNKDASMNSDINKIEILEKVLSGEFVVVPGFENINDFTKSIPKQDLLNFVSNLQNGLNSNVRRAFFDGLFEYQEIKEKTFRNLVFLLNSGSSVELVIGMKRIGKRKYEQVSHVVLANGISRSNDNTSWDLFVYDPNLGNITIKLKDDFTLEFPSIYRKDLVYNAVLYKQNKQAIDYDLGMRSLELNTEKLNSRSKRGRPYYYNPLSLL